MRNFKLLSVLFLTILLGVSCSKEDLQSSAAGNEVATANSVFETANAKNNSSRISTQRNGAPNGAHYSLNIIGVSKGKNPDFSGGNGHRIFVPLGSAGGVARTKILLAKGDFAVLDANGTDGEATFQLPEPDATNDGVTDYSVYVRGLGKPGGSAQMKSCYWDQQLATEYCSSGEYILDISAHGNNNKFQNVTNQLLYVWADIDGDGDLDRTELFSDPLDTYYWYFDNSGLKIAQLRFYPGVGTPVWNDPEPVN